MYDEKDIQGPNITVPGFKMYPTISNMLGSLAKDEESRSNPTDTTFMRMIICGPRMLCQSTGLANQSSLMEYKYMAIAKESPPKFWIIYIACLYME